MFEFGSHGSKTRPLGQNKEMPCGRCTDLISHQTALKIGQNICLNETLDESEFGSLGQLVKLKDYLLCALEATFLAQLS